MRLRHGVAAGAAVGAYLAVVRPRLVRWGATEDELLRPLPGDGLVPDARRGATMATTIDAPPSTVWPWLVQMGFGRAGWYSYDRLDNAGRMSAERILPQLQELRVGDRIDMTRDGRTWFEVARLEPEQHLVLRACIDLRRGRSYDAAGSRPCWFSDSTWEFALEPLAGGRTRLVVGSWAAARPRVLTRVADLVFWEPAHAFMQRKQFRELARRASRSRRSIFETAPTEAARR